MASDETILEVLALFADYYVREPSDGQVRLYMRRLASLEDDEELIEAANNCIDKCTWFPRVNEVRAEYELIHERGKHDKSQAYWQAMALFDARLSGKITDEQLEREPAWKWAARHGVTNVQEEMGVISGDV